MTSYEQRCIRWLRVELSQELGISLPSNGRPRALLTEDRERLYAEIMRTTHRRRGGVYQRFAQETGVGRSTLAATMTRMWAERGVSRRRFVVEPRNLLSELGYAGSPPVESAHVRIGPKETNT